MHKQRRHFFQLLVLITSVLLLGAQSLPARGVETVHFRSGDRQTDLIGYLFRPSGSGPHAAVVMLHGRGGPYSSLAKEDAEVSPKRCIAWEKRVQSAGGSIELIAYEGAQHHFDDPSASRQHNESNAAATRDAVHRAEEFFARQLK